MNIGIGRHATFQSSSIIVTIKPSSLETLHELKVTLTCRHNVIMLSHKWMKCDSTRASGFLLGNIGASTLSAGHLSLQEERHKGVLRKDAYVRPSTVDFSFSLSCSHMLSNSSASLPSFPLFLLLRRTASLDDASTSIGAT